MPKSKHQIPGRVRSVYEFINAHRDQYSVQMMCCVLEVAPSGHYDWLLRPVSNRAQEDARLLRLIRASFTASHGIRRDFVANVSHELRTPLTAIRGCVEALHDEIGSPGSARPFLDMIARQR